MPTAKRPKFARAALDSFLNQTYMDRELVILDDAENPSFPNGIEGERIRYFVNNQSVTLGEKRNMVNAIAQGDIICHWDDDDWSAPDRIADQVERLQTTGKPVAGYSTLLFWDAANKRALRYQSGMRGYVVGTSLCYKKEFWQIHQFKPQQRCSDNEFVYPILNQIAASHDERHIVARIHGSHTSSKMNIRNIASIESIPAEFWNNERLL